MCSQTLCMGWRGRGEREGHERGRRVGEGGGAVGVQRQAGFFAHLLESTQEHPGGGDSREVGELPIVLIEDHVYWAATQLKNSAGRSHIFHFAKADGIRIPARPAAAGGPATGAARP